MENNYLSSVNDIICVINVIKKNGIKLFIKGEILRLSIVTELFIVLFNKRINIVLIIRVLLSETSTFKLSEIYIL